MIHLGPWLRRHDIAYFTMEIALDVSIHTYSGGLGVLAGDTARSAADLGLPVVFVSMVSRNGYIKQTLDGGRQADLPDPWQPSASCHPLDAMVAIPLEGRRVWIRPWLFVCQSPAGHSVPVILLDTDLEQNDPRDRQLTDRLYGGDRHYRLMQETVLGIGGLRIPRAAHQMREGMPLFDDESVVRQCIFTTHTPVEAGHDRFPYDMVKEVLDDYLDLNELRRYAGDESCNLTRLAFNLSGFVNGVAKKHADTTRQMFPGYTVGAITNGVHAPTWAHPELKKLFDRYLPDWTSEPDALVAADSISDDEIVAAKRKGKAELVSLVQEVTGTVLNPDLPILGFARRMTGYKRPALILSDLDRLRAIARKHPFQIVWAGKAHPADEEGKATIGQIIKAGETLGAEIPSTYLPNYNIQIAQCLVAGADVWLNTPRPPMEASGTSGMKAALNGTLNFSVLDGWWIEAWIEGVTGWAIGGDGPDDDQAHAASLYDKLEHKILPMFDNDKERWTWMMKQSISKIGSRFNSQRMMRRYTTDAYLR